MAGGGIPCEASGYSDASALRCEESNMSARGYVGYVNGGGLGDTVVVEEESDMHGIAAGGKSLRYLLGSTMEDADEKMNMEPVLQELKYVSACNTVFCVKTQRLECATEIMFV